MKQVSAVQLSETPREFPLRVITDEAENGLINHWHKEHEFILLEYGSIQMNANGYSYDISEGDILFFASGDVHGASPSGKNHRLVIQFDDSLLQSAYLSEQELTQIRPKLSELSRSSHDWPKSVKQDIKSVMLEISAAYEEYCSDPSPIAKINLQTLAFRLVTLFVNNVPVNREEAQRASGIASKGVLKELKSVLHYINNHYSENITLARAASILSFSPNYFVRFFKKYMGMPFHAYLNRYRINIAVSELMNSEHRISEIAESVGFKDVKTFNRLFKQTTGQSPREFRKSKSLSSEQL